MSLKSAVPLLFAAGVGAVLLSKKKPTTSKKSGSRDILASGKVERTGIPKPGESPLAYEWRVRDGGQVYVAETGLPESVRNPVVKKWTKIGEADTVEDAKMMALAWIDQQPGYEQDVEVVDSGKYDGWEWRVITDPQRGHIGQYKIGEGPWLSALEGTYDEAFHNKLLEMGVKAYESHGGDFPMPGPDDPCPPGQRRVKRNGMWVCEPE